MLRPVGIEERMSSDRYLSGNSGCITMHLNALTCTWLQGGHVVSCVGFWDVQREGERPGHPVPPPYYRGRARLEGPTSYTGFLSRDNLYRGKSKN